MEENTNEVVDVVENSEVAENNDSNPTISGKDIVLGCAAAGALIGATAGVTSKLTGKALDAAGQGIYNLRRGIADWREKAKADSEAKKAEREARYQAKVAEKEAKQHNK